MFFLFPFCFLLLLPPHLFLEIKRNNTKKNKTQRVPDADDRASRKEGLCLSSVSLSFFSLFSYFNLFKKGKNQTHPLSLFAALSLLSSSSPLLPPQLKYKTKQKMQLRPPRGSSPVPSPPRPRELADAFSLAFVFFAFLLLLLLLLFLWRRLRRKRRKADDGARRRKEGAKGEACRRLPAAGQVER